MGQEIVYCATCQVRIVGSDFEKGNAFRVGEQAACQKCAMQLLATAPLPVQQQILEQKKRALDRKMVPPSPSSVWRGLMSYSPALRAAKTAKTPRSQIAAVAGIGVALLLFVGMVLLSGESRPAPPAPPPTPPVVLAGPSPQDAAADGALKTAKSFARDNPSKLDEQTGLFEKIAAEYARTPAGAEAKRELEGIDRKRKELQAADLTALLARSRELAVNAEYQKAADALVAARKNHPEPEWTRPIDDRIKELETAMSSEFPPLREKAVEARKRDGAAEVDLIREKVVRWGSARYVDDLDRSLAEVFPPVTPRGGVIKLALAEATLVGNSKFKRTTGEWKIIQNWTDPGDSLLWNVAPRQAGAYTIRINYAVPREMNGKPFGGEFEIAVAGGEAKRFTVEPTAGWGDFKTITFGTIMLPATTCTVAVRPVKIVNNLMSLHYLELVAPK